MGSSGGNAVHKIGDETVAGAKTFTGILTASAGISATAAVGQSTIIAATNSDSAARLAVYSNGQMLFGDGTGWDKLDTNLYRSAADTLKTDDSLVVGGSLTVGGVGLGVWQDYTPTLSGWTIGDGTLTGRFTRIGNTVTSRAILTIGSTTTMGGAQPGISLPVAAHADYIATVTDGFIGGSKAGLNVFTFAGFFASATELYIGYVGGGGSAATVTGTSPVTWAAGDKLWVGCIYEAA